MQARLAGHAAPLLALRESAAVVDVVAAAGAVAHVLRLRLHARSRRAVTHEGLILLLGALVHALEDGDIEDTDESVGWITALLREAGPVTHGA